MKTGGVSRWMLALVAACCSCTTVLMFASVASADPVPLAPIYGAGTTGGGTGQLHTPADVTFDAAGNLYVADMRNDRISVFSPDGVFLRAFGYDVTQGNGVTGFEVCTANCKPGVAGGGAGQLAQPNGVSFDAAGSLYVADNDNHRISVFSTDGTFQRAFGFDVDPTAGSGTGLEVCTTSCKVGVSGGAAGQLSDVGRFDIDAAGNLYVPDEANRRISVFTTQGVFQRAFGFDVIPGGPAGLETCTTSCKEGIAGYAAGQIFNAKGTSVDAAGNVYLADFATQRISVFTSEGTFLRAFGFDVVPG